MSGARHQGGWFDGSVRPPASATAVAAAAPQWGAGAWSCGAMRPTGASARDDEPRARTHTHTHRRCGTSWRFARAKSSGRDG